MLHTHARTHTHPKKNLKKHTQVATVLWSLAVLNLRPDPVVSAALAERALNNLNELTEEEMGMAKVFFFVFFALNSLDEHREEEMGMAKVDFFFMFFFNVFLQSAV